MDILENIFELFFYFEFNYPCFEDKSSSLTLKDDEISSGTLFRTKLYLKGAYFAFTSPAKNQIIWKLTPPYNCN